MGGPPVRFGAVGPNRNRRGFLLGLLQGAADLRAVAIDSVVVTTPPGSLIRRPEVGGHP